MHLTQKHKRYLLRSVPPSGETVWRPVDPHARDHLQERETGEGQQCQPDAGGGGRLWLWRAPAQEEKEGCQHYAEGGIFTPEEASGHRALHNLLHVLLYTKAAQAGLLIIKDQGTRNKDQDQNQPPASALLMTRFCSDNSSLTSSFLKIYLNIPTDHNKWDYTQSKNHIVPYWSHQGQQELKTGKLVNIFKYSVLQIDWDYFDCIDILC